MIYWIYKGWKQLTYVSMKLYGGVKMQINKENGDGIESWQEVTLVYNAALKQVQTKMEILNQEFKHGNK